MKRNPIIRGLCCLLIATAALLASNSVSAAVFTIDISLSGADEVPSNASTALGYLTGTYDDATNTLDFSVAFTGLGSPTTAAHFHGPAPAGVNAGVQIGLTGFPVGVMTGSYSNTVVLTDEQEAQLLCGSWYINIHTQQLPGGEIRGQLDESGSSFDLSLTGAKETSPNASTALGNFRGTYNRGTNTLIFNLTFTGLGSGTTAAHLHAPAPQGTNAPAVIPFDAFPTGVMTGAYSNTYVLTNAQEAELLAGQWYVNVHTTGFPGGEIRAQLVEEGTLDCHPCITGFTLVNAGAADEIGPLSDGDEISRDCELNIRADVSCASEVERVVFRLNGNTYRVERIAPYALAGDNNGTYYRLRLSPGTYQLQATPWSRNGTQGMSHQISFTVTDDECGAVPVVSCCDFRVAMQRLWIDHIIWTRNVICNIIDELPGTNEAVARLLQNQNDIGDAIKPYYGTANGNTLSAYLRTHIYIAAEILVAVKNGDNAAYNDANTRWYLNADSIVTFLHSANPSHWSTMDLEHHLYEHLQYTTDEVLARLNGDFAGDVENFEEVTTSVLAMADFLSQGIVDQFPDGFSCDGSGGSGNDHNNYKTSGQSIELSDNSIVLDQNMPNPFADKTMINYFIPETVNKAEILFYDSKETIIKTVEIIEKGKGSLAVYTPSLSQGVYTYSIVADGKTVDTKRMIHQY